MFERLRRMFSRTVPDELAAFSGQLKLMQGQLNAHKQRLNALEASRKADHVPATQLPARSVPPESGAPNAVPYLTDWKRGHWR